MKILDIQFLSENKRAIHYIREYEILVKTKIKSFKAKVIIEDTGLDKNIDVFLIDDPYYPILEAKKAIKKEIIKHSF